MVTVGDFEYPRRRTTLNVSAGVIMALVAFVCFHTVLPGLLSFFFALCVGAAVCALLIGVNLLSSRPSEKEVVKLLSSLG